ncbi:hypothetical protein [Fangia hongkongensis]|uniref:hypothetical protein n=1 Tax=Fangia hongkongensis TaxID=270495 RepID=UPI00035C6D6F|nr:hypothetical protein [Fangia hongkongensis]MBK2124626.1 hypothetical protein [Fangia hongkongensis]
MESHVLLPLKLSAKSGNFIEFYARQNHENYITIKEELCSETTYCQFCGSTETKNLHIVNKDLDYNVNTLKNLALACHLCAHIQMLDDPAWSFDEQGIIYLPSISQVTLNGLYQGWANELKQKKNVFEITEAISELMSFTQQIKEVLNIEPKFSDLLGLFAVSYNDGEFVDSLRWVPSIQLLKCLA